MAEGLTAAGVNLRLARQARGFSQAQLAYMARVSRQAVSAVESGHSDPSLRVALAIARALGLPVEELFGMGEPAAPVPAVSVAPLRGVTARVALAQVGDRFVALPRYGDAAASMGFLPADGLADEERRPAAGIADAAADRAGTVQATPGLATPGPATSGRATPGLATPGLANTGPTDTGPEGIEVRPIAPPRPTVVVAGCDPALPLLATRLALLDPPLAFAWWPCGSAEALRLAHQGLVHAAGVHAEGTRSGGQSLPEGAAVVGFAAWREGFAVRPALTSAVAGLDSVARHGLRIVNREPGAEARRLLDAECERLGLDGGELPGYSTQAAGHLQVASAVAAGLADVGVSSEPAALAYGLGFFPLSEERFRLVIPPEHAASREVQALLKVLTSRWLPAQLASIPGYDAASCGERMT
jgi:molybdate-binding protein/DNA-binding XRE family transcriptional regulator